MGTSGGSSRLFDGMNDSSRRQCSFISSSSAAVRYATPLFVACVIAPPSSSKLTSSPVTALVTSGPVMNICEMPSTITVKSVIAGEYTAPPAHGPATRLICGITPDACTLRQKISA